MTTTPLPPRPKPAFKVKWHPRLNGYTVSEPGIQDAWCFTSYQLEEYATQARADLEAENQRLRAALQVLVDNGGIGPEWMFDDARAALEGTK